eukprot:COSAG06_NODE_729_length_12742_cov_15.795064_4_plen_177_part_00
MIILPRQARDKHRESSTQNLRPFRQGARGGMRACRQRVRGKARHRQATAARRRSAAAAAAARRRRTRKNTRERRRRTEAAAAAAAASRQSRNGVLMRLRPRQQRQRQQRQRQQRLGRPPGTGAKNATLFHNFPYVCPEPVLAKMIVFVYKRLKKRRYLQGAMGTCARVVSTDAASE